MNKKEMFDLLENMTNGMNKRDLAYANLRIEDLRKKFEKVDENKWNETLEKHGENKIICSAIDYVFDGTLSYAAKKKYKLQKILKNINW